MKPEVKLEGRHICDTFRGLKDIFIAANVLSKLLDFASSKMLPAGGGCSLLSPGESSTFRRSCRSPAAETQGGQIMFFSRISAVEQSVLGNTLPFGTSPFWRIARRAQKDRVCARRRAKHRDRPNSLLSFAENVDLTSLSPDQVGRSLAAEATRDERMPMEQEVVAKTTNNNCSSRSSQ
jgi:hypothetical protein